MNTFRDHVYAAVKLKGSQQKLAAAIGCSQQQISYLLNTASNISVEMAAAIDRATNGAVAKSALRPDFFKKRGRAA